MKLLFINPPNAPFTERSLLIEPIDIVSLASYFESLGNEAEILDMDVERLEPEESSHKIKKFQPDVVVLIYDYSIPLHITGCLGGAIKIAEVAQKNGAKVIWGGKLATYMPEKIIYKNSPVDIAIAYEMEIPLAALINTFPWSVTTLQKIPGVCFWNNQITKTHPSKEKFDMDRLPITNRRLVNLTNYIDVRTILSSRGCFMKCSFCHVPGFWGNWRGQSAEVVVGEIESLVNNYGAKKVLFLDDNTTVDKQRIRAICKLIIKKGINTALGCLGTIVSYDKATMQLMHDAGFRWIHYGVESGNDLQLKKIHKLTNRAEVKRVVDETKKIGFRVRTSWIIDLPDTDKTALDDTINLILATQSEEIRIHYLSLRLGSEFYEEYGDLSLPEQYIHSPGTNVKTHQLDNEYLNEKVLELLHKLESMGYIVVRNSRQFSDLEKLKSGNPDLKIVSICPLRYGLNWEK